MIDLIPDIGGVFGTVIAFVAALSIIISVHEYGHYIVGRWCGIHAEVFSLGFGPELYSRVDRRGTRWRVAALPLGGYVKFLGDRNAASGADAAALGGMSAGERARTMHGAALWRRALTVAAGPVFNFLLSIAVFGGAMYAQGVALDAPTVGRLEKMPDGAPSGVRGGDVILAVGGAPVDGFGDIFEAAEALPPGPVEYLVRRGGGTRVVAGPFPMPARVDRVHPGSAAEDAGLRAGDVILTLDGAPVSAFKEIRARVNSSESAPLTLGVWRGGNTLEVSLRPKRTDLPAAGGGFEARWLIGVSGSLFFVPETERPALWRAFANGVLQTWDVARLSISGLAHMVSGAISTCNLQGPIGIAETSGNAASHGAGSFIRFVAALSTAVGLLNLFPIPVLDGGHLVFHAYEAVAGRPPGERALRLLFAAGLALLLALMAFALANDLFCP